MSKKVLIVDDEPNLLRLGEYTLNREGYEILTAENGIKALKVVETEHPDLVVLDVMLPDMSGIEICRQLRANPKTANMPIIMLSALGRVPDKISGLKAGADEYVTKPVDWDEMAARVSVLLERTRSHAEERAVKRGRVLGLLGAKGGVGTTTIAINLATILGQQSKSVIAAELTPGFSGFSALVNRVPSGNLRDLLELDAEDLDDRAVSLRLISLSYGPRLLLGPQKVSEFKEIAPEKATAIIRAMSQMADFVILDFPSLPSGATQAAVQQCDYMAVVIEPHPACLLSGKMTLELLNGWKMDGQNVGVIVVNRSPSSLGIGMAEIKTQMNRGIIGLVPAAVEACIMAQRVGTPLVLSQPQSAATVALNEIANRLTSQTNRFVNL